MASIPSTTGPPRPAPGLLVDAVWALGLLLLLRATAAITLPIAAALLFVLLMSGPAERLVARGVPAALAAALAVFLPAAVIAGLAVAAAPATAGWWREIRLSFDAVLGVLPGETSPLRPLTEALRRWMSDDALARGAASLQADAGPLAFGLASVLMLSFFVLWAQRPLLAGMLAAAPDRRSRIRLLGALRDARRGAGSYLATMGWINLGLAALTGLGLMLLGVGHVTAWIAIIAGLLFVPYLGPAAIALLLSTAGHGGSVVSIAAPPMLFLLLHAIEAQFVSPWWMGRRLGVGRPALLLAVMGGGWAWGVAGGVLAVPLLIAVQALLRRRRGSRLWKALLAPEGSGHPSLADSAARLLENRPADAAPTPRVRRMPILSEPASACASPTSPKPMSPRSTASR